MSWSRGFILLVLLTAACGFTPVYGPGGAAEGLRGRILVDAPNDAEGFALVQRLEERLGRAEAPDYTLSASIRRGEDGLGVTRDQETTRFQVKGEVVFSLTRIADGTVAASGTVANFTGYSAPVFGDARGSVAGNAVTVKSAQEDARRRLMVILADDIVSRLLVAAPDWR